MLFDANHASKISELSTDNLECFVVAENEISLLHVLSEIFQNARCERTNVQYALSAMPDRFEYVLSSLRKLGYNVDVKTTTTPYRNILIISW